MRQVNRDDTTRCILSQDIVLSTPKSNRFTALFFGMLCLFLAFIIPFLTGWQLDILGLSLFFILAGVSSLILDLDNGDVAATASPQPDWEHYYSKSESSRPLPEPITVELLKQLQVPDSYRACCASPTRMSY